jgi:hypothetical protein
MWREIGSGYSQHEFKNLQKTLPDGTYMFAKTKEFTKVYQPCIIEKPNKTFKQLCNENPVP